MKPRFILSMLLMMVVTAASAQSANLKVSQVFNGKVVPMERMVVTKVKGRALSKYGLNYYRSARFVANRRERSQCIEAVEQDMRADKHTSSVQKRSEKRTSIAFKLKQQGDNNRYVSLVCTKEANNQYAITVIYMEGPVKSLSELNKLINK
ncbi:MAG TPA: hypothetical protein DD401_03195 [Prevotella sp.]|nr:hypothetical protein [Prevotella sp.]